MKTRYTVAWAMLAGIGLGAAAVQGLHAQAKPPGYFIAEVDVTDAKAFSEDYSPKVPPTVQPFGGYWLVRGGKTVENEGDPPKPRIIVIAFDSLATAQAWRDSPGYKALVPIRDRAAKIRSFFVEGVSP
jgi:uncharacterized protein (DUF1330 family)